MIIKNLEHNTYPRIIHFPGLYSNKGFSEEIFDEVLLKCCRNNKKFKISPDLTIITWNNSVKKESILEWCLKKHDLPYYVLCCGLDYWDNTLKIKHTLDFLNTIKTKFVLAMDAYDVLILNDIDKITENINCKMLINGEYHFWPNSSNHNYFKSCNQFEISIGNMFLNAGVWLGEVSFCIKFLNRCLEIKKNIHNDIMAGKFPKFIDENKLMTTSEQLIFHGAFKELYPEVMLDYNCRYFQTVFPKSFFTERNIKFPICFEVLAL